MYTGKERSGVIAEKRGKITRFLFRFVCFPMDTEGGNC